jgi:hypothetical protein
MPLTEALKAASAEGGKKGAPTGVAPVDEPHCGGPFTEVEAHVSVHCETSPPRSALALAAGTVPKEGSTQKLLQSLQEEGACVS